MAQQVLPASQLVPKYHTIRRCNNYTMLQSIPCSPECKIVGKILLDHPLCYALTAIANVPTFTYTVDMFSDILHLPVETPDNPFVTSVDIRTIKGMLISDEFLTKEIRATDDFKEYKTMFMNVFVPMNQPQLVVSTQGTHRITPRAHRTPTLTASSEGKKRKQIVVLIEIMP
ncbi:hypothetical protein Tco_0868404 [Tanacetum coccineum]